jgi:hypothetical protein
MTNQYIVAECPYHQGHWTLPFGVTEKGALFECTEPGHPYRHASGRMMYPDMGEAESLVFVGRRMRKLER